jgi:RNA polymerase sigma-70 factor (ECF subfamily)
VAHPETPTQIPAHQLISEAIAGCPDAFDAVYRRYEKFVFKIAFARLTNYHDAEDVTQQVFIETFTHLHRLEDPAKFSAWLRRLTRNLCADKLRRKLIVIASADALIQCAAETIVPAHDFPCEARGIAMHALSRTLRETMELHYLQNCPLKEISARLGVPLGTIKRRLHEARLRLREKSCADP